jgi:hypothetical protein
MSPDYISPTFQVTPSLNLCDVLVRVWNGTEDIFVVGRFDMVVGFHDQKLTLVPVAVEQTIEKPGIPLQAFILPL